MDNNRKHHSAEPQNQRESESNYKNIETSVNNPSYFDDNYESKAENEIAEEETKTEKQQRAGKKGRGVNC